MESARQWKNCRILIRDEANEKLIADTKILSVEPAKHALKISAGSVNGKIDESIVALVFAKDGLRRYKGKLHGTIIANELEVILTSGGKKEERACERYAIQAEGVIDAVVIDGKKVPLSVPIEVVTVNMGVRGVLIRTFPGSFEVGDRISLTINLKTKDYRSTYEIVRVHDCGIWNSEYGCKDLAHETRR
jgi:hypothetical protein